MYVNMYFALNIFYKAQVKKETSFIYNFRT